MIDFLAGVPGKLAAIYTHLTSYLSSTRAAKIDNLDTTISSRAEASTALTNATWTNARAGYLDRLDATVSTRAAETTPLLDVPIASGIISGVGTASGAVAGLNLDYTTQVTYRVVVNIAGQGVLNFAGAKTTGTYGASCRVTIDGQVVGELTSGNTANSFAVVAGAATEGGGIALDQIPYKTSLKIEHKISNSDSGSTLYYKYRKTA